MAVTPSKWFGIAGGNVGLGWGNPTMSKGRRMISMLGSRQRWAFFCLICRTRCCREGFPKHRRPVGRIACRPATLTASWVDRIYGQK